MNLRSRQVVPPGGWFFQQGSYRISGVTFNDLVINIIAHRKSNGWPVDESLVADEVEHQICVRWPDGAKTALQVQPNFPDQKRGFWMNAKDFATSLLKLGLGKDKLVSQHEANRRGAICAACHNNTNKSRTGTFCSSCQSGALNAIRRALLGNAGTTSDRRLLSCAICGCDNKLAVWFPLSALQVDDSNRNAYPTFCWKKEA